MIHRFLFVALALASLQAMAQPGVASGAPAAPTPTGSAMTSAPVTMAPVTAGISGPVASPTAPAAISDAPVVGAPVAVPPTASRAPNPVITIPGGPGVPVATTKTQAPTMAPSSATQFGICTTAIVAVLAGMWM